MTGQYEMTNAIIELKSLQKYYGEDDTRTQVLSDVSLRINAGDFVSISGPSGCGKSTLLSILGLLDRPTSGDYSLAGVDTNTLSEDDLARVRNRHIGFVFQSFNLIEEMDVFENVALPLRFRPDGTTEAEVRDAVAKAIELVGLAQKTSSRPSQLSGGQQQRVAIARAIVGKPSVVLADEPTGNLDRKTSDAIMQQLVALNEAGVTVCLVTHDPLYAGYARTRFSIADGRLSCEAEG